VHWSRSWLQHRVDFQKMQNNPGDQETSTLVLIMTAYGYFSLMQNNAGAQETGALVKILVTALG